MPIPHLGFIFWCRERRWVLSGKHGGSTFQDKIIKEIKAQEFKNSIQCVCVGVGGDNGISVALGIEKKTRNINWDQITKGTVSFQRNPNFLF